MLAHYLVPIAVLTSALLVPLSSMGQAPAPAAASDEEAFVKALPAPGAHDRPFLEIPSQLATKLSIDLASLRSVDPGLVCQSSSRTPTMSQATIGQVGQIETVCTPAGWSQGVLTLKGGASYMTTCGDGGSARLTANADVTVGTHSWQGTLDSAPPVSRLSHACTGWVRMPR